MSTPATSLPESPLLHRSRPGHIVCSVGPVLMARWSEPMVLEDARVIHETAHALARQHRDGVAYLNIIARRLPPPDDATRKVFLAWMQERMNMRGTAMVVEPTGFAGAAARSVFTGLVMLAQPVEPMKVVASVDEAAAWIVPMVRGVTEARVRSADAWMRARMAE